MDKRIEKILAGIVHPETGLSLLEGGFVESSEVSDTDAKITLVFPKSRDPFINSIRRRLKKSIEDTLDLPATIIVKENPARKQAAPEMPEHATAEVKNIIAIASGKGGVGKSTVTANLAVMLASAGYRVGILDSDIYGPSQPKMFGTEGFVPEVHMRNGKEVMAPAENYGVKVMSIGYFIKPEDALVWRGPMATNALRQLIHQTEWGKLDWLLVDLPPGTGDVHLTILKELKVDGAVIITTPQQVSVADALRAVGMFGGKGIEIPVIGIVENMAWFTPQELPCNRYYIFGSGGGRALAEKVNVDFLGEIPIMMSVMQGGEEGRPDSLVSGFSEPYYREIMEKIVKKYTSGS
ncbi:iron-sulfur protein nubpl [Holotrichia oblita]|uniref:Iron-sulfur protein nubpl n=1 Tax=Holotrichia oblita TaxID=644536 RepID=A0ACB9TRC7_HOLOL|nr:iron-sulfur protein nubpl [Holotrichia oblita]